MARTAIAATIASVVLLSVLVVADATVVAAQDSLASSTQLSHVETRELLLEQSLAGTLSLDMLSQAQSFLSFRPAHCAGLQDYLGSVSTSSSISGEDSGVTFMANASAVGSPEILGPIADNLTVMSPFSGAVPGLLNLREDLTVKEVGGGSSVVLDRREVHVLNVPVHVDSASSLCVSTTDSLAASLANSPCNATVEQVDFDATLPGLTEQASAQGFELTAGWDPSGACSVSYWFRLVEVGVPGATGSFDWTLVGYGTG